MPARACVACCAATRPGLCLLPSPAPAASPPITRHSQAPAGPWWHCGASCHWRQECNQRPVRQRRDWEARAGLRQCCTELGCRAHRTPSLAPCSFPYMASQRIKSPSGGLMHFCGGRRGWLCGGALACRVHCTASAALAARELEQYPWRRPPLPFNCVTYASIPCCPCRRRPGARAGCVDSGALVGARQGRATSRCCACLATACPCAHVLPHCPTNVPHCSVLKGIAWSTEDVVFPEVRGSPRRARWPDHAA